MKSVKVVFVILLSLIFTGIGKAQDCGYYAMSKGMILGYQNFDAKDKLTGTRRTTCLDIENRGGAIVYKVKSEFADAKNSNPSSQEFEMRCENGMFYMNMQDFVDPKSMESFKDMEVSIDSKDMVYPPGLSAGMALQDASITITGASGGISMLNMLVNITNRKVVAIETITVPAGTFECYKITYDVETKLIFKFSTSVTEYINMGVGNVKTITYDKKGKLMGTTMLHEVKK